VVLYTVFNTVTCEQNIYDYISVHRGHGKPGKLWNFIVSFSRSAESREIEVWVMELNKCTF